MTNTSVLVRAQALGGKFLGMGVGATPPPTLVVNLNGQQVAQGTFILGNSGQVVSSSSSNVTGITITVDPNSNPAVYVPGTYYLEPAGISSVEHFTLQSTSQATTDSYAAVELPLTGQEQLFEFFVTASRTDTGGTVTAVAAQSLSTGNIPSLGVVVPIPGLRITNATAVTANGATVVTASVAMMCGCMITPMTAAPAEPYWPESEFTVLTWTGNNSAVYMTCIGNSIFTATLPAVDSGTQVTISASQPNVAINWNQVLLTVP